MEAQEKSKINEQSLTNLQVNSEHGHFVKEDPVQQTLVIDSKTLASDLIEAGKEDNSKVPLLVISNENSDQNNKHNHSLYREGTEEKLQGNSADATLCSSDINTADHKNNALRRTNGQNNDCNKQVNVLSLVPTNPNSKQSKLPNVKPGSNLKESVSSVTTTKKKNDASKPALFRSQSLTFNFKRNNGTTDDSSDYFKIANECKVRKVFSADYQPNLTKNLEKASSVIENGSFLQKLSLRNTKISNSEFNNYSEQPQNKSSNKIKTGADVQQRVNLELSIGNGNQNLIKNNNIISQEVLPHQIAPLHNSHNSEKINSLSKQKSSIEKNVKKSKDRLPNCEKSTESLIRFQRDYEFNNISAKRTNSEKICKLPVLKTTSDHVLDFGKLTTSQPLILPPLGISPNDNVFKEYLKRKKNWSPTAGQDTLYKIPVSTKPKSTSALPLIKTSDARSRNYLLGNLGKDRALLGVFELERYFPLHKVQLFVGTWNVNNMLVTESLDDFLLPKDVEFLPDIYVIGTQEASANKQEWEIRMQETLGSSHVLFHSVLFGTLHLAVFMRRDLVWMCSVPEVFSINTRIGKKFKTKGAVAICFQFFGTSFLFITSHFTAHDEKLKERILDFEKVLASIDLPKTFPLKGTQNCTDSTMNFDCVFWCGDLNFRINQERPAVISLIQSINSQRNPNYEDLLREDQLRKSMNEGKVFRGFSEARINFMPTYKYNIGTSEFDSSVKLRIPSYTDRILYRNKRKNSISCILYNSAHNLKSSDHKPVYCCFEVQIKPGCDNVPLAAGLFNREVYLEALKRRANSMDLLSRQKDTTVLSNVCSVM